MPPIVNILLCVQESAVGARAEEIVLRLLYQLIVILVATRVLSLVVHWLGQTDVSGEILAGLLLGPSCLGLIAPGFMQDLFHPSTSTIFVGIAQIGLVLLMFLIGLEFEFGANLANDKRKMVAISLSGLVAPFVLGFVTAEWFHSRLANPPPLFGFRLFFAVAMSITAIPILGRIFMELGLSHTRTAALTISAAAIEDVTGWLMLGVISLLVAEKFTMSWALGHLGGLAAFLLVVFFVVKPLLGRFIAAHLARHGRLRPPAIAFLLILLFAAAAVSSNLGVFAIIGGFVMGVALHGNRQFVAEWKRQVGPLVMTFFLPIFFTYTGLRTDIGKIGGWNGAWLCALVCAVAFVGKMGGVYGAARAVGEDNRSALTISVCMNTRALMELIVLNIGLDMGVLPRSMFTMLVIMALASTFMATPLIRWLMKAERRVEPPEAGAAPVAPGVAGRAGA